MHSPNKQTEGHRHLTLRIVCPSTTKTLLADHEATNGQAPMLRYAKQTQISYDTKTTKTAAPNTLHICFVREHPP